MNDGTQTPTDSRVDPDERRRELIEAFESAGREKARQQIAILPYYHAIENAVTKPNQGTWVTRYFRTKWRPALGTEASEIVLALRFFADKETGETWAGYDTIAEVAGLSVRCVERWLSHQPPKNRSGKWLEQWRLLHTYFVLGKTKRYNPQQIGNRIEYRRSTNKIRVAMDDPVHPDDEPQLYVHAAERIVQEEAKTRQTENIPRNRPADGYGPAPYAIEVEKSARNRPADGYPAPTSGRSRSLSERITSPNVNATGKKPDRTQPSLFAQDPRVATLGREERRKLDALVDELGDYLRRKDGFRDDDVHQSAGAHKRAVYFLGEQLVRRAMRTLDDRIEEGRAGRNDPIRNPSAAFWGIVRNLAAENGVSLEPAGAIAVASEFGAPARPVAAARGPAEEPKDTPEERARIYSEHLFPFQYRLEHDRDPSEDEKRAAYEQRLAALRGGEPSR